MRELEQELDARARRAALVPSGARGHTASPSPSPSPDATFTPAARCRGTDATPPPALVNLDPRQRPTTRADRQSPAAGAQRGHRRRGRDRPGGRRVLQPGDPAHRTTDRAPAAAHRQRALPAPHARGPARPEPPVDRLRRRCAPPWGPRLSSTCWATDGSEAGTCSPSPDCRCCSPPCRSVAGWRARSTPGPRRGRHLWHGDQDCPDGVQLHPRHRRRARPLLSRRRLPRWRRPRRRRRPGRRRRRPGNRRHDGRRRAVAGRRRDHPAPGRARDHRTGRRPRRRRARQRRRRRPRPRPRHLQRERRHAAAAGGGSPDLLHVPAGRPLPDPGHRRRHGQRPGHHPGARRLLDRTEAAGRDHRCRRRPPPAARRDAGRSDQRLAPAARSLRRRRRAAGGGGRWRLGPPGARSGRHPGAPATGRRAGSGRSPARCRSCRSATWAPPATGAAASCSATGPAAPTCCTGRRRPPRPPGTSCRCPTTRPPPSTSAAPATPASKTPGGRCAAACRTR